MLLEEKKQPHEILFDQNLLHCPARSRGNLVHIFAMFPILSCLLKQVTHIMVEKALKAYDRFLIYLSSKFHLKKNVLKTMKLC